MITDLQKVLDTDVAHPVVKKAARRLLKTQYFTPADFFKKLTRRDSEVLGEMATILTDSEVTDDCKGSEYENMIMLASILSMAEGVYLEDEDEIYKAVKAVAIMCIANYLHRQGAVSCYYKNFTFGDEGDDRIIMERLDE